ncbi:LOW QUALITY PROTEIN: cilia- and flagella-associated protein 46 [Pholidichthys leucotaenia]
MVTFNNLQVYWKKIRGHSCAPVVYRNLLLSPGSSSWVGRRWIQQAIDHAESDITHMLEQLEKFSIIQFKLTAPKARNQRAVDEFLTAASALGSLFSLGTSTVNSVNIITLKLGCMEICTACLKMYFEGNPPTNQFLGQPYLWQGQLSPPAAVCGEDTNTQPSMMYFQTVCPLLQAGWCLHLVPLLKQVVQSLEKVSDQDNNVLIETSRRCNSLAVIYKLQELKRAAFLLELAQLALQVAKHQKVASIAQHIVMECFSWEINLLKKMTKMNDYSKASVAARLKEIGWLHQWLQIAVRDGGPRAVQAVYATQWNICLLLLQHNLKKLIKASLLKVAQTLEEIQRCTF